MSDHLISIKPGQFVTGSTSPDAVTGYEAERVSTTQVHQLLAWDNPYRDEVPSIAVTVGKARPRSGTLVTVYTDRALAHAAFDLLSTPVEFIYTSEVDEIEMNFVVVGTIRIEQHDQFPDIWYVNIGFQETETSAGA